MRSLGLDPLGLAEPHASSWSARAKSFSCNVIMCVALNLNPPDSVRGQRSAPAFRLANIDLLVEMTPPASFSMRHAARARYSFILNMRILQT